ncbi:MAG: hypothetical protein ACW97Z_00815 [Candidatus Hodarchaeales archaeon]
MNKLLQSNGVFISLVLLLLNPHFVNNHAIAHSFGVSEGEIIEFSVEKKPERPDFTLGSSFPLGIDLQDIRALTQLTMNNFTLQAVFDPFPPEKTNFSIEILGLDEIAQVGIINVSQQVDSNSSHGLLEYQLSLNNSLGEPIISTDWHDWIRFIDSLSTTAYYNGKKIVKKSYDLTYQTFTTNLIIKPSIPSNLRLYINSVTINQSLCYFTQTGIQAYMVIISTYSIFLFGDFTSVTYYKYTGINSGLENISIPNEPFNPLQIILPVVGGIGIIIVTSLAIILLRKKLK